MGRFTLSNTRLMITKVQTRTLIKQKRKELTDYQISLASQQIMSQIAKCERFKEASTVFLYAAFDKEVQTKFLDELARNKGKKVAYPKIQPHLGEMDFYCVNELEELHVQNFKSMQIREPDPERHRRVIPAPNDIMILPGVAFDVKGNRIGYGGGFYDRYLQRHPRVYKLGVCMAFQLFDKIAADVFDIKMDEIITDTRFYLPF